MFQPDVTPDAIPPRNYPPHLTTKKAALYVLIASTLQILFVTAEELLQRRLLGWAALPPSVTDDAVRLAVRFLLWDALAIVGYATVSIVTLERGHLRSRYGSYAELLKLQASLPLIYICTAPSETLSASGVSWSVYLCGFFVGLLFTYSDNQPFLQRVGCKVPVPALWSTLTRKEGVFVAGGLGVSLAAALQLCGELWRQQMLTRLVTNLGLLLSAFGAYYLHKARGKRWRFSEIGVHFHHYINGGLLPLLFTAFRGRLAEALQGVFFGVYVEGIAVWGMDPILF